MKVRMRTNLGTQHAKLLGVNAAECQSGMEPEVGEEAGRWLVKRQMADELPVIRAATMRAVPPAPIQAVPPEPSRAVPPYMEVQPEPEPKSKRKTKSDDAG